MSDPILRRCSLYDPASNLICDEWAGHDGGMHTPVGMEQLALREAEERRFLARKHDGKIPYGSKAEAKRAAAMTTATFGGARKMAYRCPVCDSWHVGASR